MEGDRKRERERQSEHSLQLAKAKRAGAENQTQDKRRRRGTSDKLQTHTKHTHTYTHTPGTWTPKVHTLQAHTHTLPGRQSKQRRKADAGTSCPTVRSGSSCHYAVGQTGCQGAGEGAAETQAKAGKRQGVRGGGDWQLTGKKKTLFQLMKSLNCHKFAQAQIIKLRRLHASRTHTQTHTYTATTC